MTQPANPPALSIPDLMQANHAEVMGFLALISDRLAALESAGPVARPQPAAAPQVTSAGDLIASDAELDSQYGNPEIRKDPPRWTGQSYAGARMSECPTDYLLNLAGFFDWKAQKDDEQNAVVAVAQRGTGMNGTAPNWETGYGAGRAPKEK